MDLSNKEFPGLVPYIYDLEGTDITIRDCGENGVVVEKINPGWIYDCPETHFKMVLTESYNGFEWEPDYKFGIKIFSTLKEAYEAAVKAKDF